MSTVLLASNGDARASLASASVVDGFPERNPQPDLGALHLPQGSAAAIEDARMVSAWTWVFGWIGFFGSEVV